MLQYSYKTVNRGGSILLVIIIIVVVLLFLFIGAGIQGANKAKAAAYLAGKYNEEQKKK